ncbi:AlpA family transcriptional regulator [Pseudoalteromonas sp. SK18]|uniref:helix-turn-helix transcriptional regulator n=1 Tax=Pseudoalteromonas sp. SK18 TaxID=1938366 RepID=UPI000978AF75|nr:AlpA family phage regulatory protein [Pseudoalteromonas sp. SK18]
MKKTTRIIRPKELAEMLGVTTVTLWNWRQQNKIPQPISFGTKFIGWKESTIEAWLSEKENNG